MRKIRASQTEKPTATKAPLIVLVPLPFGLGLFGILHPNRELLDSFLMLRAWEWARYDYADHEPANAPRWSQRVLEEWPQPSSRLGVALEAWLASKSPKVIYSYRAKG